MKSIAGNIKFLICKIQGKWRLLFGFCPACNSDAPEMYDCTVCQWYRTSDHGMPSKTLKKIWWSRFLAKLNFDKI